jgi:hypothetical protein
LLLILFIVLVVVLVLVLVLVLDSLSSHILHELPLFEDEFEYEYDDDVCGYRLDLTLHPVLRFFGYKSH